MFWMLLLLLHFSFLCFFMVSFVVKSFWNFYMFLVLYTLFLFYSEDSGGWSVGFNITIVLSV